MHWRVIMKVIVEVKNEQDIKKIKKLIGKEHVAVIKSPKERILENLFSKFRVKLPAHYKFDREEIHAR
jgi:hypothetical protein